MRKVILKIALMVSLLTFPLTAATSEGQVWGQILSQGKLSEHLRLWAELQPRYGLTTGGFTTVLTRPGIGWQFSPEFTAWIGYAWTPLIKPTSRDEHRIWLQGSYNLNLDGIALSQRLRLESRFIEGAANTALRLRYLLRGVISLSDGPFSIATYNEVFFSLNQASPFVASGFDQNRFFLGGNYKFSSNLNLDAGYMCNYVNRPNPQVDKINHVFMFTLFHSFDLTSG